jgi:hypothetical protein
MAFDFPAAPAADEVYTSPEGVVYSWNGEMWKPGPPTSGANPYVLKAGDAMQGVLALIDPDPTAPTHSAHKKYVDRIVAEMMLYQGIWNVASNTPDLNIPPNAPLNGYSWIAQTVDPNVPETAAATIPGIGGNSIAALNTIRWNATLLEYEQIRGPTAISQMTINDTPPAGAFHGQQWFDSNSGKHYVYYNDGTSSQWVMTSGGGGGTGTGGGGAIPDDAPSDTLQYARQSATVGGAVAWTAVSATAAGPVVVTVADAFPASPVSGQLHFLSTDASLYCYFVDASSVGSWVEVSAL